MKPTRQNFVVEGCRGYISKIVETIKDDEAFGVAGRFGFGEPEDVLVLHYDGRSPYGARVSATIMIAEMEVGERPSNYFVSITADRRSPEDLEKLESKLGEVAQLVPNKEVAFHD